jgi:type IV pilus assembly protein PilY1
VLSTTPPAAATNVAISTAVSVQFSEAMRLATVAVTLTPSAALGTPAWSAGDTVVTFTPTSPLAAGTTYSVAVSGQDLSGNALAFPGRTFTTASAVVIATTWDAAIWDQATWQ